MPDYNPAVAAGIQVPQTNFAGTLGTAANIQAEQARSNLYTLQGLQQERRFNALKQMGDFYNRTGDAGGAARVGISLGLEPETATQMATFGATQRGISAAGGMLPSNTEQLAGAAANYARAANEKAQYPGFVAQSQQRQAEAVGATQKVQGEAANSLYMDPSPENVQRVGQTLGWNPLVAGAIAKKSPDEIRGIAMQFMSPNMSPEQMSTFVQPAQSAQPTQPGQPSMPSTLARLRGPGEIAQIKSQAEKQGSYFSNLYSGIAATGNTAANARDEINIAKSVINDPQFYSGTGEGVNLAYKRALASFGVDPGASLPQEAFRKIMSANILQQVNGLRAAQEEMGAAGGRIFQSQIEMMEKAAQNPDNSVAANRFLTELADRASQRNMKIADMAANYKGGKLDPAFEKQLRDYTNKNPLFSDQELKFPKLIGMDPKERQYLKDHPNTASIFDSHYGTGASKAVIGQ